MKVYRSETRRSLFGRCALLTRKSLRSFSFLTGNIPNYNVAHDVKSDIMDNNKHKPSIHPSKRTEYTLFIWKIHYNGLYKRKEVVMTAITDFLTNDEVLDLIGERIKQRRLGINIPVDLLSEKAGVNRKTVLELESGKDIRLSSMIKILRGLNMLHALEGAFPDVLPGGGALSARGHLRIKAGRRRKNETP